MCALCAAELVKQVIGAAETAGVQLLAENALEGGIYNADALQRMLLNSKHFERCARCFGCCGERMRAWAHAWCAVRWRKCSKGCMHACMHAWCAVCGACCFSCCEGCMHAAGSRAGVARHVPHLCGLQPSCDVEVAATMHVCMHVQHHRSGYLPGWHHPKLAREEVLHAQII